MLGEPPLEVLSLRDGDKREEVNQGRGARLKEVSLGPVWALLRSAGIYLPFASQIPAVVFVFISVFITLFPGYLVCLGAGNASVSSKMLQLALSGYTGHFYTLPSPNPRPNQSNLCLTHATKTKPSPVGAVDHNTHQHHSGKPILLRSGPPTSTLRL